MPRRPKPHWDKRENAYRTEAGGRTRYFRGVARDDHLGIATAFAAYLAELDAEAHPPEPDVADVCSVFCAAARGVEARTVRSHRERLMRFMLHDDGSGPLGGRKARDVSGADLRRALRAWEAEGLSEGYRAGIVRSVKAAWSWAASEDGGRLIPGNPLAEVKPPTVGRSPERYAERAEVAAFLRFAWRRAGAAGPERRRVGRLFTLMVRFVAHTGCRPDEACRLRWDQVDWGRLRVEQAKHKTARKTGKPRVILLPPGLVRPLEREAARADRHSDYVFWHRRGEGRGAGSRRGETGPWTSNVFTRTVRNLRKLAIGAGVKLADAGDNRFVLYRLRHTYISDGLMGGVRSHSVAEVAGTSERMISKVYGHLLEDHVKEAGEAIRRSRKRGSGGK